MNQLWNVLGTSTQGVIAIQSQFEGYCLDLVQEQPAGNTPFLFISSRISVYERNGAPTQGYNFYVYPSKNSTSNGSYQIGIGNKNIINQSLPIPIFVGQWYNLAIVNQGSTITFKLNNQVVTSITDNTYTYGMTAMGSGWHHAWFDNFVIMNNTQSE